MGLAILCSGQGNQTPEMFQELAGFAPPADAVASVAGALDIDAAALLGRPLDVDLYDNQVAQPLLAGYQLAAWAAVRNALPTPVVVAGYSLGEVVAYGVAGAIDAAPLMRLVGERARLMQAAQTEPQSMLAFTGCPVAKAKTLAARHGLAVAIVNGPDHVVMGGPVPAVDALEAAAPGEGVPHVRRLKVSIASHTPHLADAVAPFAEALAAAPLASPAVPVVAGVDAAPVRDAARAAETLSRQVAEPIRWFDAVETCLALGATVFLELGPGRALTKMLEEARPDLLARALADFRTTAGVGRWAARHLE